MATIFPKHPDLGQEVAAFMAAHGVRPTTFGMRSVGDPSLIANLEAGRELRSETLRRIRVYMTTAGSSASHAHDPATPTHQPPPVQTDKTAVRQ